MADIGHRMAARGDGEGRRRDENDRQRVVADDDHLDDELQAHERHGKPEAARLQGQDRTGQQQADHGPGHALDAAL